MCCFYLQKKCRMEFCPDSHQMDDDKPCSNMARGCKQHKFRNDHKVRLAVAAPGGRYDPVAAAERAGVIKPAPMTAIKALAVDVRPAIPPPATPHPVPRYMQRKCSLVDVEGETALLWSGKLIALPDRPARPGKDRGLIESEDALKEYGKHVWVPQHQLGEFTVGDAVEFEL
eukprot:gene26727-6852_t